MPRPWIFLINPFEVATEKSYRTAKKLGDYTAAALGAQPKQPFIDIETLRNLEQSVYKSNIKGGETLFVLTHTFEAGEKARFVNRGNTDLAFALVAEKNEAMPSAFVTVPANNELITDASALGNIAANRFLIAKNLSATGQGAYTIQLL